MADYTWKRLDAGGDKYTETYIMDVPGGQVIQTVTAARQGRGENWNAYPVTDNTAMVFVPREPVGQ